MRLLDPLRYVKHRLFPNPIPEYFPVDAWTDPAYEDWFFRNRATPDELSAQRASKFSVEPKFSIIVPLYKTPIDYLTMMVESVLSQTYGNFELILVNATPEDEELAAAINAIAEYDDRAQEIKLDGNYGITENTNQGIDVATGDFICFLDHDDFIEPDLFYEYTRALNEDQDIDILYCDEDLVQVEGSAICHVHPLFKPEYSPEFLLCKNYIIHLLAVRASIVRSVHRPDASFDGTQDYNMVLQAARQARKVHGVQKVLYHWRIGEGSTATNPDAKPYSQRAYRKSAFLRIREEFPDGRIIPSGIPNIHDIWFEHDGVPRISLVVDCANDPDGFEAFIEMLNQSSAYSNIDIVPASDEGAMKEAASSCPGDSAGSIISDRGVFTRLNLGASRATGSYLLFLSSSDIFATPDAIEQLLGLCAHSDIGAVAAKILYSDTSVKSFGIAITPERIMPLYRGYPDEFPAYQCNTRAFQNLSAVSWHGMMVSRELFLQVGGFDDSYESEIGSADFCQKVLREGLRIVQTPTVKLQTNEQPPKQRYDCIANSKDFTERDLELFDSKWPGVRMAGDPYFNKNFDQASEYCQIALSDCI